MPHLRHLEKSPAEDLDLELVEMIVRQPGHQHLRFAFLGGEFFLHPHYERIMGIFDNRPQYYSVVTNGNLTERIVSAARSSGLRSFPTSGGADVLLVPLRCGAGTGIKSLEAMAAGSPVVATSKGTQGLEVINGEHLFLADSPRHFADAVQRLPKEENLRRALVTKARVLVEKKYSWEKLVIEMERPYDKIEMLSMLSKRPRIPC